MSCRFKNCEEDFTWCFMVVYEPMTKIERDTFWGKPRALRGLWQDPWFVARDFNVVRFPCESSRGGRLTISMGRFTEIMEDLELRDLPLQGGVFSWRGGLNSQSKSWLDRFLISKEWENKFVGLFRLHCPYQFKIIVQSSWMEEA